MKTNISGCFRTPQWIFAFRAQLLFGLLFFGIPSIAFPAADVTIATIQAAWRSREAKLNRTPFRIEWAEKRMRRGASTRPTAENAYKTLIIAKGKKFRYEWSGTTMTKVIAWQGKGAKVLDDDGSGGPKSGAIWDTHKRFVDFTIRVTSLGIWPSNAGFTEVDLSEYSLRPERRTVNGVSCCVLGKKNDSPIETELYLNPANGFLIQRIVGSGGQVDYKYAFADKIGWIPRSWRIVVKSGSFHMLAGLGRATVIEEPPDSTFDIVFAPGTFVHKSNGEKVVTFVVDQDGNLKLFRRSP